LGEFREKKSIEIDLLRLDQTLIEGRRMRNLMPVPLMDVMRYPIEVRINFSYNSISVRFLLIFNYFLLQSCDALLDDHETKDLMNSKFNLLILDGAFPECALGLQYKFNVPFMYINTVGFYTGSISRAGSPVPYSITPHFALAVTDDMSFLERITNTAVSIGLQVMHSVREHSVLKYVCICFS
jgi:hypothetical protein